MSLGRGEGYGLWGSFGVKLALWLLAEKVWKCDLGIAEGRVFVIQRSWSGQDQALAALSAQI